VIKFTVFPLLFSLALALSINAQAGEKASYVGDGRYVSEGKSVDDAVLRQRNNEYSERERDRQDNERRYERSERREREYDRESQQDYESNPY
jgi:hypothetical protein